MIAPEKLTGELTEEIWREIKEGRGVIFLDHCQHFPRSPCVMIGNQNAIDIVINALEAVHTNPPKKMKQRMIYRTMSIIVNKGLMGAVIQKQFLMGVTEGCRKIYPQVDGMCIGFMEN